MQYILISTACLSISYIAYRLVFRNETSFRQLRIYLLLSILISGLVPFSNFNINLDLGQKQDSNTELITQVGNQISTDSFEPEAIDLEKKQKSFLGNIDWIPLLKKIYRIVSLVLIFKILFQVLLLFYKYFKSDRVISGKHILIYNHGFKNTFSFFNWIFISQENTSEDDLQKIITHETIHATQYHSIDLLLLELLTAVMWFNPFVWMMKKSVQLVHEYLADEGVLNNGVDKVNYQALLINLISEERLISISSSFNQSLIKKRMIMMNKNKFNKSFNLKFLALLPIATFLFFGVACVKSQETNDNKNLTEAKPASNDVVTAIALTKMNVLYVGVDNPVKIAVSGYESTEISPFITNGIILYQGNGNYIINPKALGNSIVTVKANGVVVQNTQFRVRGLPDPVVKVAGKKGGRIKRNVLAAQEGVIADMPNFDFDLEFKVVEFAMSTTDDKGYTIEARSKSNRITVEQKKMIENAHVGARIHVEDVKAIGPDGSIRTLASIVFEIVE